MKNDRDRPRKREEKVRCHLLHMEQAAAGVRMRVDCRRPLSPGPKKSDAVTSTLQFRRPTEALVEKRDPCKVSGWRELIV